MTRGTSKMVKVAAMAFPLVIGLSSASVASPLVDPGRHRSSAEVPKTVCTLDPRVADYDPSIGRRTLADAADPSGEERLAARKAGLQATVQLRPNWTD